MMSLELESKHQRAREEIGKRKARVLRVLLAWVRISVLLLGEWAMSNSGPNGRSGVLLNAKNSYAEQPKPELELWCIRADLLLT